MAKLVNVSGRRPNLDPEGDDPSTGSNSNTNYQKQDACARVQADLLQKVTSTT